MGMNYESRVMTIARSLNNFLRQFKVPDHLTEQTALERIKLTAEAINKRLPASLHPSDLEARLSEMFIEVLESHKSKEWPHVEAFASAVKQERAKAEAGDATSGDRNALSREQQKVLDEKILPMARKWLGTGLDEHARKTLEFWGETV